MGLINVCLGEVCMNKKKIAFISSTITLAVMLVVFGVFMVINAVKNNKDDTYSYVKVTDVVKYDDYIPVEITDGKVVAYYGEMENVAMTLPATYSLDEYGRVINGEDYEVTEIGEEVFKNVNFLYFKLMADNLTKVGKSAFENAQHIHLIGGENFQLCEKSFMHSTLYFSELIFHGTTDPNIEQIESDALSYTDSFDVEFYSQLANDNGYMLVKTTDTNNVYAGFSVVGGGGVISGGSSSKPSPEGLNNGKIVVTNDNGSAHYSISSSTNNSSVQELDMSNFNGFAVIGDDAFKNSTKIQTVKLGRGFCEIHARAFESCSNLSTLDVGLACVDVLGQAAFYKCTSLTKADFSLGIFETCSQQAFLGCSELTDVRLPRICDHIGGNAFGDCKKLSTIVYYENNDDAGYVFENGKMTISKMKDEPSWYYSGLGNLIQTAEIKSGITFIGKRCFYGCLNLTSVSVASSVTAIHESAFEDCEKLYSINADGVKDISEQAFQDCKNLTNVYISSIRNIGSYAFRWCTNLRNVTVKADVISTIEVGAFSGVTGPYTDGSDWTEKGFRLNVIADKDYNNSRSSSAHIYNLYMKWDVYNSDGNKIESNKRLNYGTQAYHEGELYDPYDDWTETIQGFQDYYRYYEAIANDGSGYKWVKTECGCDTGAVNSGGGDSSCLTGDTLINLANGKTKRLKDITYDDELLVLDHDTGKVSSRKAIWIHKSGKANGYQLVKFSDGSELKFIGLHSMFNADLLEYVDVRDESKFHVGTHVIKVGENNQLSTVSVVSIEYIEEEVEYYEIITSGTYNVFANNLLTSDGYTIPFQNMYEFNRDYTYKSADRQAILYGTYEGYLFTDEYLNEVLRLSYSDIEGFRGREWGRLVELGYLPEEHIAYLIAHFLNSDEQRIM